MAAVSSVTPSHFAPKSSTLNQPSGDTALPGGAVDGRTVARSAVGALAVLFDFDEPTQAAIRLAAAPAPRMPRRVMPVACDDSGDVMRGCLGRAARPRR